MVLRRPNDLLSHELTRVNLVPWDHNKAYVSRINSFVRASMNSSSDLLCFYGGNGTLINHWMYQNFVFCNGRLSTLSASTEKDLDVLLCSNWLQKHQTALLNWATARAGLWTYGSLLSPHTWIKACSYRGCLILQSLDNGRHITWFAVATSQLSHLVVTKGINKAWFHEGSAMVCSQRYIQYAMLGQYLDSGWYVLTIHLDLENNNSSLVKVKV